MTEATLLLRQLHPSFVKLGRPTSAAFRPTPKDESKLSVYDGDLISAQAAFEHYRARGLRSAGVMAVTRGQAESEGLLVASTPEVFPEHAEIDFTGLTGGQCEKKAKRLRDLAVTRGWLHQAETPDP
jgi:hypothetical protein